LSYSSWLISCFWHYRSFYSSWTTFIHVFHPLNFIQFGISYTALSWIKSYLLNRSFYVSIENSKSSVFQLLYEVPQGSVLGPLLFILYTTPLSAVISTSLANHQLYADDTQLLLSFSALDLSHNITHLEKTWINVSNWMYPNFLSLNPSKIINPANPSQIEYVYQNLIKYVSMFYNLRSKLSSQVLKNV